jgi:cellulose synthase/poly-beta-1,6-N-acetylglucosamine synthase-like glycosyltransferase
VLVFLFWFFVTPAALMALYSVRTGKRYLEHVEGALKNPPAEFTPPVTLIVPVKGLDYGLASNLRSLAHQDYPDFELLIVCASASDEAPRVARASLDPSVRVITAGPPPSGTGEKVHNLLEAVRLARPESEVLVFADSDGQVSERWLRSLVAPLQEEDVGAATGFRWYFPEDGGFWPLLRSVWDSAIAGSMRDDGKNFAWGGGTAIRRATFDEARVADFWQGAVSDDYRLTKALTEAGLGIRFVPGAMVATTGSCGRGEFLAWATRQLIITRVYRPGLWWAGFAAHIAYCGAMLVSLLLILTGNPLGLAGLVVTVVPGMGKGMSRAYAGRLMFPEREEWFDRFGWAYFWLTPIATWIWLYVFYRSALTRTIEWRGNTYELVSPAQTRCVASQTSNR